MLVECLRGDIVDMGTLKDTSTQLCGLTNRILADDEKIHTILTCLNCIYLILKGGSTTPDPPRNGAKNQTMNPPVEKKR